MSKLESAFSKALKEHNAITRQTAAVDGDVGKINSNSQLAETEARARSGGTDLRDVVSARSQIKKMSHGAILSDEELARKKLIFPRMRDVGLLNIYRNLRTKLLSSATSPNFITLVTSVVPGGGSSLIAANIAATFAFDEGKTALLIDGNVLTPSLARLFETDVDRAGLMDYLESEDMDVSTILCETGIARLRFIPSGKSRENSSEYFTSRKMQSMLKEVIARYPERYPIIDAPSIKDSADARILLDLCDQVVLVVPYGQCSEDDIKNAAQAVGGKLVGVVLNQF